MFQLALFAIPLVNAESSINPIFAKSFSFLQTKCNSFYPLYPPAEGIPIDFSLAPEALQMSTVPDILILPSDLAHFVRVV